MKIHHFGYAVENLEEGIKFFTSFFNFKMEKEILCDNNQKVRIAFLREGEGDTLIELLEPLNERSPIFGKRGLLHICFETKNLEETIKNLRNNNWVLIKNPEKAEALEGMRIAFLYSQKFGLIELLEVESK